MGEKKIISHKIAIVVLGLFITVGMSMNAAAAEDRLPSGVSIGGTDVSGLTKEEALTKVREYVSDYTSKHVSLFVDDNTASSTISDLGYYWKNTDVVDEALNLGKQGNVIERYMELTDLSRQGVNYNIEYDVNDEILSNTIEECCSEYNVPHVNAGITRDGDGFSYSEGTTGRIIDMDATVNEFHQYLLGTWNGNEAELKVTMMDDLPEATLEDCQKVTDLLGTYTTTFTGGSSNYNRNKNIANGARLINGTVVYVGDTFSANALLEPWTEEHGWYAAGTYVNGKVEDSLGGGICQVSTTLYNALLKAEIDIVERYPHSMSVGYVPLSQDAALAGTYKDLKFENNTDAPLYIEAYCSGNSITFNVYGHETRDPGRRVEFISETTSTIQPSEVVTEDGSQPVGYRYVTERGHVGYTAKLIKRVYQDDELVSEEVVNTSSYAASPTHVVVGTGAAPEETSAEETSSEQQSEGETSEGETSEGETQQGEENTSQQEDNSDDNHDDGEHHDDEHHDEGHHDGEDSGEHHHD